MTEIKAALLAGVVILAVSAFPARVALAQAAAKGDPQAAAKGKISLCIGCHGIPKYRTAYPEVYQVPMIAGQSAEYLARALQAYRSGERSHPSMQGVAKSLSDQDISDLAAYYGGPSKQTAAPAQKAAK